MTPILVTFVKLIIVFIELIMGIQKNRSYSEVSNQKYYHIYFISGQQSGLTFDPYQPPFTIQQLKRLSEGCQMSLLPVVTITFLKNSLVLSLDST